MNGRVSMCVARATEGRQRISCYRTEMKGSYNE